MSKRDVKTRRMNNFWSWCAGEFQTSTKGASAKSNITSIDARVYQHNAHNSKFGYKPGEFIVDLYAVSDC